MRPRRTLISFSAVAALALYAGNSSWTVPPAPGKPSLLAHRGVHQRYICPGLDKDGCSAVCILPPTHDHLENTIDSMRAAFAAGADVVELDVHGTADGGVIVFHDWRLECRTNGTGVTRERDLFYLKSLDLGYGYTADGGRTFPFRGRGIGEMPTLPEVLDAFPDERFLIDVKSNDSHEADALVRTLAARTAAQRGRLLVYGGETSVPYVLARLPELRGLTRTSLRACLTRYAALGWTGEVPAPCRNSLLFVPIGYAPYFWGWPNRFLSRMRGAGSEVFVVAGSSSLQGLDEAAALDALPRDYSAGILTDRIELIGPLAKAR